MSENSPLIYVDLIEEKPRKQKPDETAEHYAAFLDTFQAWRWVARSGDNQRKLARSSERYLHKAGAMNALELLFSGNSNVYLRQHEMGNVLLQRSSGVPF